MRSKGPIIAFLILLLSFNILSVSTNVFTEGSSNKKLISSYDSVGNYSWTEAAYIPHHHTGYAESTTEDFSSSVSSSEIHVYETSSSYYQLYAGVHALVSTFENSLNISFEGRASSSRHDQVIMGVAIIEPLTMEYLDVKRPYDYQSSGISSSHDTGYQTFNYTFDTFGYNDVLLFFFYVDATVAYWEQNIWVDNLKILTDTSEENENPDVTIVSFTIPIICLLSMIFVVFRRRK